MYTNPYLHNSQMKPAHKNTLYLAVFFTCIISVVLIMIAMMSVYVSRQQIDASQGRLRTFASDGLENAQKINEQITLASKKQWYNPIGLAAIARDAQENTDLSQLKYEQYILDARAKIELANDQTISALHKNELVQVANLTEFTKTLSENQIAVANSAATLKELTATATRAQDNQTRYLKTVEETQKKDLLSSLADSVAESQIMTTFLTERATAPATISNLDTYRLKVIAISDPEYLRTTTFSTLEKEAQTTIIPLLVAARTIVSNLKAEDTVRRLSWIESQKIIWNDKGQTPPKSPLGADISKQVYINLKDQYTYFYDQGELINSGPITSGRDKFETITGTYAIYAKKQKETLKSPFEDVKYELKVDYWMPFYSGYGFHDAYWRTVYGGADYKTAGSHGCINTPYDLVAFLYNWADVGTKVVIQ